MHKKSPVEIVSWDGLYAIFVAGARLVLKVNILLFWLDSRGI